MATVFLVEDSEAIRTPLRQVLESAGHTVFEAVDGVEGLQLASEIPGIEIMIVDINMPRLGGIPMVAELRQQDAFASVPIVALTSESSRELKEAGRKAGIDMWIIKPVKLASMPGFLEMVLGKADELAKRRADRDS